MSVKISDPSEKFDADRIIDGCIVTSENNELYGSMVFRSEAITLAGGFANKSKRVAFLTGEIETLQALVKQYKLQPGGDCKAFKIIVEESFEPEFEGQQPKIKPATDNADAEILLKADADGVARPIFRTSRLVEANSKQCDELIKHDSAVPIAEEVLADFDVASWSA